MKFLKIITIFWLIYNPALSQINRGQFLLITSNNIKNEYDEYKITVYHQKNSKSYQKIIEIENQLEYFDYLGKIWSDDGNEYHLFRSYSLPVGTFSLYYFSTKNYYIYQLNGIQEYQYPDYFKFNSEKRSLEILSYDVVDCGSMSKKYVTDYWSGENDNEKSFKSIPDNQKVINRISF
jgi:hypothetical protein